MVSNFAAMQQFWGEEGVNNTSVEQIHILLALKAGKAQQNFDSEHSNRRNTIKHFVQHVNDSDFSITHYGARTQRT